MSTHSTELWLETRDRFGQLGWVDVATDTMVDLCIRLSVGRSDPGTHGQEIHLNMDQAEAVAQTILQAVEDHRQRGTDPTWAGETLVEERTPRLRPATGGDQP